MDMTKKNEDVLLLLTGDEEFQNLIKNLKVELEDLDEDPYLDRINKFISEVIGIFNLNENFRIMLRHYILYGKLFFVPSSMFSEVFDDKALTIRIFEQPTEKDFEVLKKYIKDRTKHLPKHNEIKNIKNRVELEEMYRNKKEYEDFDTPISNKEIAKDYLGSESKNKQVLDEIKKLKKLRNKYFHTSEKS